MSGFALVDALLTVNQTDPDLPICREKARGGKHPDLTLLNDKILLHKGRLVVSDGGEEHLRTRIIDETHSRITTAHPGRDKTRQLLTTRYWWPRMMSNIDRLVSNCLICRASKPNKSQLN